MKLSRGAVATLLTSLFPSGMVDDLARECEVVVRDRKIDPRMLVWTLAVGFAVDGEARSVADYRRAYNAATNQTIVASSFYDRFSEELHELLRKLLEHALEEVAVPHHVTPEFDRFSEIIAADATIFRLQQFLAEFDATHQEQSGVMLYLVHSVTGQSVISDAQLILMELAGRYGFPPPNIPELLYQEAKQPAPARQTLIEEVCVDPTASTGA